MRVRRHVLVLATALLAVGAGAAPARESGGTPVAFVAVEKESRLVAVDLTAKEVVGRIEVPKGPRNVAAADPRHLLVTSPRAGAVTLVDSFTRRVVRVFRGFGRPLDVAVEGRYGYVTDSRRDELVVIDLERRRVTSRIRVAGRPQNVAVGDVALVTHNLPENFVTIVSFAHPSGRGRVSFGRVRVPAPGAGDVSEQPDSAFAYVTLRKVGGLAAIDWGNRVAFWGGGAGFAQHVQFDYVHGRRVWGSAPWPGEVFALASRTGRQLRRLGGCPGAGPIAFGGQAWLVATCKDVDALAIWDTRTWKRRLVPVGDRPHGVAIAVVP